MRRPVVLVGPVGSGKTTLARRIHVRSGRDGAFVEVSGGESDEALARDRLFGHVAGGFTGAQSNRRGAVSEASGGTLFVDDVALLPIGVQAALLRAVESGRFQPIGASKDEVATCRWLFATTVPLHDMVDAGLLLSDLRSRLGELIIEIPPLSDRSEDILLLAAAAAESFMREHRASGVVEFAEETEALLLRYDWPGNIRELENVVERAVVHAGVTEDVVRVRPRHLPERVREADGKSRASKGKVSNDVILHVLEETGGNQAETARRLNIHRNTVRERLREIR